MLWTNSHGWPERNDFSAAAVTRSRKRCGFVIFVDPVISCSLGPDYIPMK